MTRYVAFLRGINLGNRRFKMDELRAPIEALNVENVRTFLASGNVVFDHPDPGTAALEPEIEGCLERGLGLRTEAFVRTLARLGALALDERIRAGLDEGFRPHVIFLKEDADTAVQKGLRSLETPDDRFHVLGREVVWLRRGRMSDSTIKTRDLERALQDRSNTMRNLNTVRRAWQKFGTAGD